MDYQAKSELSVWLEFICALLNLSSCMREGVGFSNLEGGFLITGKV